MSETPETAAPETVISESEVPRKASWAAKVPWAWAAAGLGVGAALASLAHQAIPSAIGGGTSKAAIEQIVKDTILDNPELIPEAINRLQHQEVAKLLASNREAIEKPFAGAWAGAKDGDVVLVEFFDFNCPYCRQSAVDVERLLAEDQNLKIVFRDMPVLGPDSERFALASLSAAEQGRYVKFYRDVFSGQGQLSQERLIKSVRAAGMDETKVVKALNSKEIQAEVEKNLSLGRALGLTGTPSYVVGDRILSGAVGYEELKKAVAEARKKAEG